MTLSIGVSRKCSDSYVLKQVNRARTKDKSLLALTDVIFFRHVDGKAIYVKVNTLLSEGSSKKVYPLFKYSISHVRVTRKVLLEFNTINEANEFRRENGIAELLRESPGIVAPAKLVKVIHDSKVISIWVQKHYDRDLFQMVMRGVVRQSDHRILALGMARALKPLHDRKLIHRDVKLQNFLVEGKEIVVTDFGLSGKLGEESGLVEAPIFIAPGGNDTLACDIYKLGVAIYGMVTGLPPMLLARNISFLKGVDHKMATVVKSCMQLKPKDRPTIDKVIEMLQDKSKSDL